MKAEKKQETRVSKAIAEAWEGSTSAKQAADKYVVMLKEDQALRDEATENWLERIAYKDVAMHPVNYPQDMFERFRLPNTGVPLGDATREDLENAIAHEGSRSTHHAQQKVFYEKMQKRLSGNAQVVREVWTTEEAARAYDEALA